MKIKKLLILAALPMIGLAANAQEKGPQKNDFTVAATLSYNNSVMGEAAGRSSSYKLEAASIGMTRICLWVSKVVGFSWMNGNWF